MLRDTRATFAIGQVVRTKGCFVSSGLRKPFDPHAGQAAAHPNPARDTWTDIKNTAPNIRATILDLCLHAPAGIKVGDAHVAPQRQSAAGNRQAACVEPTSVSHTPTSRSRAVKAGDPHIGGPVGWTVSPGLGRMAHERGDPYCEDPNRTQTHSVVDVET